MVDRRAVRDWVARYEAAWRAPGTDALDELFAEDVTYSMSPWAQPVSGLPALREFWDVSRTADESFEMRSDIVALDGSIAVVRVGVKYADGQRWRDLWVIELDSAGRCARFEEWPFSPTQPDGHEDDG